jgi:nucleotide-binding universal stress UspA family protein
MFKKILIAYDGSDQSKRALRYATTLSSKFISELIILTVYHEPVLPVFTTNEDSDKKDLNEYLETIKQSYAKILDNAGKIVKRDFPSVNYNTLLREGRPSSEIISVAENEDVDLIILGSRGIGGVTGWVLGSTSKSVVESCKKPVLVVK